MSVNSNHSPGFARYRFEYLEYIDVVADAAEIDTPAVRKVYLARLTALERTLKHLENVGIDATVVFHGKEDGAKLLSNVTVRCSDIQFKKVLDIVTKPFCTVIC